MNTQIEVTGWHPVNGATVNVSTYNPGRRNRRNRWTVDTQGDDDEGVVSDTADYQFVKNPEDRRRIAGVAFNIGHLYEVDVVIDDEDGRFEHTLIVDATFEYQVISYFDQPSMRVKAVRITGDVIPDTPEEILAYEDEAGGPDPMTVEEMHEEIPEEPVEEERENLSAPDGGDDPDAEASNADSAADDEERPPGDVEVAATEPE